jgi:hypothetical protein
MNDRIDFDELEPKDLEDDASPRERLKYIKHLVVFHKTMFGNLSHNDMQKMMDKLIKVSSI